MLSVSASPGVTVTGVLAGCGEAYDEETVPPHEGSAETAYVSAASPSIVYVPPAALVVEPPTPPSVDVMAMHTPGTSAPLTAPVTDPVMLAARASPALMLYVGEPTDVETPDAPDTEAAPVAVLLNHCVT